MSLRRTLHLGQLYQGLIAYPLFGVGFIDRLAGPVNHHKHGAIRTIRIVRYGQGLNALRSNCIHPVPKTFRILAVKA